MDNMEGNSVQSAYSQMKRTSNINGTVVGYPGIEAIFDAFGVVIQYIELFATALQPTLLIALPKITVCYKNLKVQQMRSKRG